MQNYIVQKGNYDFLKYFVLFFPYSPLEEIKSYLQENYDRLLHSERTFESNQFKKMICWYDYIKNYVIHLK